MIGGEWVGQEGRDCDHFEWPARRNPLRRRREDARPVFWVASLRVEQIKNNDDVALDSHQ
jgi:hypothetical protein